MFLVEWTVCLLNGARPDVRRVSTAHGGPDPHDRKCNATQPASDRSQMYPRGRLMRVRGRSMRLSGNAQRGVLMSERPCASARHDFVRVQPLARITGWPRDCPQEFA